MKIGIVGYKGSDGHFGIGLKYAEYFSKFGFVSILTPNNYIDEDLNLVVLPGGPDLSPAILGQPPTFYNSNICPYREYFYQCNFPRYVEKGIPVFGVCLGFQQICVKYGCNLKQHDYFPYSDMRDKKVEELALTAEGEGLKREFNIRESKIEVNSLHHQGVLPGQINTKEITVIATSKKYPQNIEAIIHNTLPIAGVQYHPEELGSCPLATALIRKITKR